MCRQVLHTHSFQPSGAQRLAAEPRCSLRVPGLPVGAQWGLVPSCPVGTGPSLLRKSEQNQPCLHFSYWCSLQGSADGYPAWLLQHILLLHPLVFACTRALTGQKSMHLQCTLQACSHATPSAAGAAGAASNHV